MAGIDAYQDTVQSEWASCEVVEKMADDFDEPDWVIWTEERTKTEKGWSQPTLHSGPDYIPAPMVLDYDRS